MVQLLQNLIILNCITNCNDCPGKWKNEHIEHWIVCNCQKCDHGIRDARIEETDKGIQIRKQEIQSLLQGDF